MAPVASLTGYVLAVAAAIVCRMVLALLVRKRFRAIRLFFTVAVSAHVRWLVMVDYPNLGWNVAPLVAESTIVLQFAIVEGCIIAGLVEALFFLVASVRAAEPGNNCSKP